MSRVRIRKSHQTDIDRIVEARVQEQLTDKMAAAVYEIANLKDKVAEQEAYIAELEYRLDRSRSAMERRRDRTGGDIGPLDD